ncbi:MAG: hypothetical protein ACHP6I_02350 [Rickettsiales bacterium]
MGEFYKNSLLKSSIVVAAGNKNKNPPPPSSAAALPKNGLQGRVWGGIAGHFLSYIVRAANNLLHHHEAQAAINNLFRT